MLKLFLNITSLFVFFIVNGQTIEKENLSYKGGKYDVFIVRDDSLTSGRFKIHENQSSLSEKKLFDSLSGAGSFFLINAGIVDASCNLLGLFINDSQKKSDINLADGQGNFYLKPNGFIGFEKNKASIMNSQDYNPADSFLTAVQSGPMLLSNNTINPNFNKNSPNRFLRAGVGIFTDNGVRHIVFAIALKPVNFYEFASFFSEKFKCSDALNLEGGTNCSFHLPSSSKSGDTQKVCCKYIYLPIK